MQHGVTTAVVMLGGVFIVVGCQPPEPQAPKHTHAAPSQTQLRPRKPRLEVVTSDIDDEDDVDYPEHEPVKGLAIPFGGRRVSSTATPAPPNAATPRPTVTRDGEPPTFFPTPVLDQVRQEQQRREGADAVERDAGDSE